VHFKMIRSGFFMLLLCATTASAQMAVHAVTGVVKIVTPNSIWVSVDGDTSQFKITSSVKPSLVFPQDLRASTTEVEKFQKTGDYVVLYYYGFGDDRTAVAVTDLGAGPYTRVHGTVTAFDKHTHMLTLKDDDGKQFTASLGDNVVVDKDNGIDSGKKFSPHKGDQVRMMYGNNASPTVVFLRESL
jgi:hypothetical protein